jgi:hypothetical protein
MNRYLAHLPGSSGVNSSRSDLVVRARAFYSWRMKYAAAALAFLLLAGVSAEAGSVRPIVVELYTSQGCNSCGPANALAAKVAQKPGVLLLSFSVTYWDMFGWKDTLASDQNTRRQKAYAASLRRGGVYTPQMIIDGTKDVPGGREDAVSYALELAMMTRDDGMQPDEDLPAIAKKDGPPAEIAVVAGTRVKAWARTAWSVGVNLAKQPGKLRVWIDRAPDTAKHSSIDAAVWLFRLRSGATVKIGGGENNGQTINYRNVVTGIEAIGRWRGEPLWLDLPKSQPKAAPYDSVAVVVQQGGYGRVVGAAYLHNAVN